LSHPDGFACNGTAYAKQQQTRPTSIDETHSTEPTVVICDDLIRTIYGGLSFFIKKNLTDH
jgi:hypothetical protein